MTLTRPTPGVADSGGPVRRTGAGRAVTVLVLVALAALIPLLGPSTALHGTGEAAAPGAGGIALLRTVLFAALCVPVGELFVNRLAYSVPGAEKATGHPLAVPRTWSPFAAVVGFVAALGLASVVATGNLAPGGLSDMDVGGLHASRDGKLALLEVNAFLVAGLCTLSRRPSTQVWPLAAVIVAEALRAHPPTEQSPLTGSGLTLVHLTCAALWVGGLLHALRTLRLWHGRYDTGAGAALLGLYARVAAVLLAAITATGVWSSLRRMPPGTIVEQLTTTAYGRALLAKVLLVAAVAALALWARSRLRRAADPLSACAPARAEVVALGLVVAVSGLLTALPVPIRW
ncbi:membrane protein [Streptomyces violarus]|uniref:Putative copper export protein n=1 Tax=Streptomyces violarus TaxID=67380 RepID=A0A7W4ZZY3_9ACTN|nr:MULTISPECIES: CopD family protein [Streptomyces]MBB3081612.1 putative copper export protein [Streptomyces violarus]WRU02162.1 CopD family protein [Streptomyces sp. CGMCC 4.1772]GHD35192.1 membrane protein [Streptomyces violarus]